MRMSTFAGLGLLTFCTFGAIALGCGGSGDGSTTANGEQHIEDPSQAGAEMVRCWGVSNGSSDSFFSTYTVSCHYTTAALGGLTKSYVNVDAIKSDGTSIDAMLTSKPDADVVVGQVSASSFPLKLQVSGIWESADESTSTPFHGDFALTTAADAAHPLSVKAPFAVWPVTFVSQASIALVSGDYSVGTAPFYTDEGDGTTKTSFTASASTGVIKGSAAVSILNNGTAVKLSVQTAHATFPLSITGPAIYVIDETGVRVGSAADLSDGGTSSVTNDGGGATDTDAGAGDDAADTTDAGPASTCGGPTQMPCSSSSGQESCNAGTRYNSNDGTCVTCGNNGQTYCVDDPLNVNGGIRCDNGTVYRSTDATCVSCGNDSEPPCVDDPNNTSGSLKCNAGTRYDTNSDNCITCGAAGQTYCVDDASNISGSEVCNAGLTPNFNGVCATP